MSKSNSYNDLYSKVRRIYISLPDFSFFHRPSGVDDIDSHFVGRERIISILKNWLDNKNENHTGSYLITGYRGMGKTSFVGKVIDEIIEERRTKIIKWQKKVIYKMFKKQSTKILEWPYWKYIRSSFIFNILALLPAMYIFIKSVSLKELSCWTYYIIAFYCFLFTIWAIKFQKEKYKTRYILKVKINISNEVANARDVMSLFAYSIQNRLDEYFKEKTAVFPLVIMTRCLKWTFIMIAVNFLHYHLITLLQPAAAVFYVRENNHFLTLVFSAINQFLFEFSIKHHTLADIMSVFILILVIYVLSQIIARSLLLLLEYFGISLKTPRWFIAQFKNICTRIDAEVKGNNAPYNISLGGMTLSFRNKASKQYGQASVREIELLLLNIIEEIHKSWILNCRLIIILDELDKLSRFDSKDKADTLEFPEFTSNENGISEDTSQQDKKHRILSLLGQLKYFISTAKAKFIFIAGHELYDAYLADVSDREFSISSIFNGVINVDSFFTYNSRTKDITKLTEIYLCKQLMGNREQVSKQRKKPEQQQEDDEKIYNLENYRKWYIKDNLTTQETGKVIVFLRQFITYLTFMSNGAPKKLTAHFERYVISKERFDKQEPEYIQDKQNKKFTPIVLDIDHPKKPSFYLGFGYYDQQKIGFIHYLAYPIFENLISPSSEYGDKLLIASSFLIAHIYKHHNSGFSWRNLEYLPELIDSNRTPELRDFINSIIGYLGQIHLTTITSGIYTYKFPMRLVEEISVFTKKSEELSAIFNFSLDYSLAVKKYYYRLLDFYRQKQDSSEIVKASLRHNIGDIHMANDEYTEAIVLFRQITDSIEQRIRELKSKPEENMTPLIVRYMRIMLKLGLAYEKRNTIDSAYLVYSNLTTKLIAHREINEESLNLHYKIAKEENDHKYLARNFWQGRRIILLPSVSYLDTSDFDRTCYPKPYIKENENNQVKFWIYGDELTDNLCDFLTPNKEALITKLSVYEDLRMAYQPILAKLFAVEKYNICGITKENVRVAEAEFQYMYLITNSHDKYLLQVDFYRKLGDILYYKNNWFFTGDQNSAITLLSCWGYDLKNAVFDYCYRKNYNKSRIEPIMKQIKAALTINKIKTVNQFIQALSKDAVDDTKSDISEIIKLIPKGLKKRISDITACGERRNILKNIPCSACRYYDRSLSLLKAEMIEGLSDGDETKYSQYSKVFLFLDAIYYEDGEDREVPRLVTSRYNNLTQAALTLDAMGNTLLSCASEKDEIDVNFLNQLFSLQSEGPQGEHLKILKIFREDNTKEKIQHFKKILLYFWAAMKYHEKAGNNKESVQCLLKIMKVTMSYLAKHPGKFIKQINMNPIHKLLSWAINQLYSTPVFYNIKEVRKLQKIINQDQKRINLSMSSIMPEVEELLLAYYEIALEQKQHSNKKDEYLKLIGVFYGSPSLSCLRNDSLTYNRVISLMFKAQLNERIFGELGLHFPQSPDKNKNMNSKIFDIDEHKINDIVQKCLHLSDNDKEKKKKKEKNELLEFLIADSIFCLTSITDFILPAARTTLFTNSFCQSVYKRLFHWIRWKEAYEKTFNENNLESELKQLIERHHWEMLRPTYLKEMANWHCSAAREMQHEGDYYQNFIKGLYLLDDDLQNNTCQFYFALERYKINSRKLEMIETKLENNYYKPNQYYDEPESV